MNKLWHDDVRPAPDESWIWAKTNGEAVDALLNNEITECSLDHDLGAEIAAESLTPAQAINLKGSSPQGDGKALVKWMILAELVPEKITIHSWNYYGAQEMQKLFRDAGYEQAVLEPFRIPASCVV